MPTAPGPAHTRELWSPSVVRLRRIVNVVNLATPLGLALAAGGRAKIGRGPHGLLLAHHYRAPFPAPRAPAVTIGDVVLLRMDGAALLRRPQLLDHEARHAVQYACWVGPLGFLPAYLLSSAWSWWRTGDFAIGNRFEQRAGLADGGYLRRAELVAARPARSGQQLAASLGTRLATAFSRRPGRERP